MAAWDWAKLAMQQQQQGQQMVKGAVGMEWDGAKIQAAAKLAVQQQQRQQQQQQQRQQQQQQGLRAAINTTVEQARWAQPQAHEPATPSASLPMMRRSSDTSSGAGAPAPWEHQPYTADAMQPRHHAVASVLRAPAVAQPLSLRRGAGVGALAPWLAPGMYVFCTKNRRVCSEMQRSH
jgi:hypothetical protein